MCVRIHKTKQKTAEKGMAYLSLRIDETRNENAFQNKSSQIGQSAFLLRIKDTISEGFEGDGLSCIPTKLFRAHHTISSIASNIDL